MNVTRDVVHDLLPLYMVGEASDDSRALIEEYLRLHPDEKRLLTEHAAKATELLGTPPPPPPPDFEKTVFERTRRYNRWRTQLLAFTIAYGLFPLAFVFKGGQITWIMFRDRPLQAVMFWIAAAGCALARWILGWRLRTGR
jgi:hypothetical protein